MDPGPSLSPNQRLAAVSGGDAQLNAGHISLDGGDSWRAFAMTGSGSAVVSTTPSGGYGSSARALSAGPDDTALACPTSPPRKNPDDRPGTTLIPQEIVNAILTTDPARLTAEPSDDFVTIEAEFTRRSVAFPELLNDQRPCGGDNPRFRRPVTEAVVAWRNAIHRANLSDKLAYWSEDIVVLESPGGRTRQRAPRRRRPLYPR